MRARWRMTWYGCSRPAPPSCSSKTTAKRSARSPRDELRPEAAEAVAQLRRDGHHSAMLTGDNHTTAAAVAKDVGIHDVHAELRPEDKARLIE